MVVNDGKNEINDNSLLYFGSHNLSPSAWGRLQNKGTKLQVNNWELGVVFPPGPDTKQIKEQIINCMTLNLTTPKSYDLTKDKPFMLDLVNK